MNERDSIERDMREGERGEAERDKWLRVKRKIFLCKREKVEINNIKKETNNTLVCTHLLRSKI